eukprot:gene8034-9882_t
MNMQLFSMSTAMNLVHGILAILLFVLSIMSMAVNVLFYKFTVGFTLMLLSFWFGYTLLYGGFFYGQYYFMYTFAGRGAFYIMIGLFIRGMAGEIFFGSVVSVLLILFGIGSVLLGVFSNYESPKPFLGPADFIPYNQKSVPLSSQQDPEDSIAEPSSSSSSNANPSTFTL